MFYICNNKNIELMIPNYVTIEILHNDKCIFITYKSLSVYKCINKLRKEYGEVIIYSLKTDY